MFFGVPVALFEPVAVSQQRLKQWERIQQEQSGGDHNTPNTSSVSVRAAYASLRC